MTYCKVMCTTNSRSTLSFVFGLVLLFFNSCINHSTAPASSSESRQITIPEINHAKGFEFEQTDSTVLLRILYPSNGETADSIYLIHYERNKSHSDIQQIAIQSTTHFAFFDRLVVLERLIGLCGKNYLSNSQQAQANHLEEICSGSGLNLEKIASLQPDILMLYPFEQKDISRFHQLGVNTLFITEYLELTPLGRAEWLKLFGVLVNSDKAISIFEEIEREYIKFRQNKTTATMAFNLPHGENWNMPSGNSITANLLKDAGLDYVFADRKEEGNVILSMEEAYRVLSEAEYWVIIGEREAGFTMEKLIAENKIYATFPSVREGKVIFCNTAENDYFSRGVVEPHLMLMDLLKCLGKLKTNHKQTYFHVLQ